MSEYQIEKGVPLEKPIREYRRYPFNDMEIGDRFMIGVDARDKVSCSAYLFGRRHGKRFAIRLVKENGVVIGARCWRVI